jgi:hypothetical protein
VLSTFYSRMFCKELAMYTRVYPKEDEWLFGENRNINSTGHVAMRLHNSASLMRPDRIDNHWSLEELND